MFPEQRIRFSTTVEEHLTFVARAQSKEQRLICLFIFYLELAPVEPNFEVMQAGFVSVLITPVTPAQIAQQQKTGIYFGAYFMFNVSCVIRYENPNRKVDVLLDHMDLFILYNGFKLGGTKSSSFVQARKTSRLVYVNIVQTSLPVPLTVFYSMSRDMRARRITFGCDLTMQGQLSTVAGIKSPPFRARVRCELVMVNYIIVGRHCKRENLG